VDDLGTLGFHGDFMVISWDLTDDSMGLNETQWDFMGLNETQWELRVS